MDFHRLPIRDLRLVGAVFTAVIEQCRINGYSASYILMSRRVCELLENGERDFDQLKTAGIRAVDGRL